MTQLLTRRRSEMASHSRRTSVETNAWLSSAASEPIIDPQRPIVDAHHHLWDRPHNQYLLPEFLAETASGHHICASVYIDCGSFYRKVANQLMAPLGEVEFANGIAAMAASGRYGNTQVCAGIVGTADISVGASVAALLDAQMAASSRFRGIRLITKWDADESLNTGRYIIPQGFMYDADFRAGFAQLGPRQLSFDAMVYHPQLVELADLARTFPETTIILNHIGGLIAYTPTYLSRKDEAIDQWRQALTVLAQCPNVYIKLGGLGMSYLGLGFEQRSTPAPSTELAAVWGPFYQYCIEQFGPNRCMFESNFPPDRAAASYAVTWNALKRVAAPYSDSEQHDLFYGTAVRAYRLAIESA